MKRLAAMFLSLLLLWMQLFVMAPPATADAPAKCTCCSCKDGRCCVGEADSAPSTSQPAAPVPSAQFNHHLFAAAASTVWLLPSGEAEVFFIAPWSLSATRVPLFTRDCALLI